MNKKAVKRKSNKNKNNEIIAINVLVCFKNMASVAPEEVRFAKNTTILASCLHEMIHKLFESGYKTIHPDIVLIASQMMKTFDAHYLIQGFIENTHEKCWDSIHERNEKFFLENAKDIFQYLPMDKVNLFTDVFLTHNREGESVISQASKNQLWELFAAMTRIAIKYIHKHRSPYEYANENGEMVKAYGKNFFNQVNLSHHAKTWGLVLEFPVEC